MSKESSLKVEESVAFSNLSSKIESFLSTKCDDSKIFISLCNSKLIQLLTSSINLIFYKTLEK